MGLEVGSAAWHGIEGGQCCLASPGERITNIQWFILVNPTSLCSSAANQYVLRKLNFEL